MTIVTTRVLARWHEDDGRWVEIVKQGPVLAVRASDTYYVVTASEAEGLVAAHRR